MSEQEKATPINDDDFQVAMKGGEKFFAALKEALKSGSIGFAPSFIQHPDGRLELYEVSLVPYKPGDEQYGVHPAQIVDSEGES